MPRTIEPARKLPAKLAGLLIADGQGFPTRPVPEARLDLEGFVLPGLSIERHRGMARAADARAPWFPRGTPIRNSRQVSIVSSAELAEIARALGIPEVKPEWLGANLVVDGVERLSMLPRIAPVFPRRRGCRGGGSELAVPWTRPGYRCTVPRQGSTRSRFRQGRHASQGLGGVGRAGRHDT